MEVTIRKVPIPELTAEEPGERILEFYKKIGWDGQSVIDPMKVRVTREDHTNIYLREVEHALNTIKDVSPADIKLGIGFLWMNSGPSCEGETPGMVELLPGWITED